jgi:hypothetical protein
VESSCGHGDEPLSSIEGGKFLNNLSGYWLHEKEPAVELVGVNVVEIWRAAMACWLLGTEQSVYEWPESAVCPWIQSTDIWSYASYAPVGADTLSVFSFSIITFHLPNSLLSSDKICERDKRHPSPPTGIQRWGGKLSLSAPSHLSSLSLPLPVWKTKACETAKVLEASCH